MINLNKPHTDLLDNKPLTKANRIKREDDYKWILICLNDSLKECRKNNKVPDNGNMARGLKKFLIKWNKEKLVSDPFVFEVLAFIGYGFGSLSVFKRKFKEKSL